jgi:ubiquinone/menaquinone biosynthesis C-methylase UbiE
LGIVGTPGKRSRGRPSPRPRGDTARRAAALGAVLLLLAGGCTWAKRVAYEGFGRDRWQRPEEVVAALGIAPGERVADLGAGGGYFTFRLADAVGPGGRVYAVDVDPGMVDYLRKRAAREDRPEVVAVRADPDDTRLPEPVDLVFTCNTYHHLEDREAYFRRLRERIRPGGRLAVIDFAEGRHATPREVIQKELVAAGYRLQAAPDFLERQSFLVFAR